MSANLYWEPRVERGMLLPRALKYVVAPQWFGHDGTLCGDRLVGPEEIAFLTGIRSATTDTEVATSAKTLIEAIIKYGEIHVRIA